MPVNRLWVQLTAAFTLVILVAVGAIALLINRTTGAEFRQYITHSGMRASGSGLQQLVSYYEQQGSWRGVESLLGQGVIVSGSMGLPMMGTNPPPGLPGGRLDVVLADSSGKVVFDSTGRLEGRRLSLRERSRALPITKSESDTVIGYLLLAVPDRPGPLGTLEQQFLDRMRRVLVVGAGLAVALGLVVGVVLSRSLTAPLQRLAAAARAVARGDLGSQVKAEGGAEIAEVGRAFNEMTGALAEAETQRQNLVADVAHELRTPLTVVQGSLQAILDGVYPMDKAEIARLYDETRLLSRLVDDLRELALADAGQLSLNLEPTDAAQVIEATIEGLSLAAEAGEVRLTAETSKGLPWVRADCDRLAQVLRNLLVNALRHTPVGGSVAVSAFQSGKALEFAVADTGEGIPAEDLPHVFERFWRADPARARPERASPDGSQGQWAGGSGLGLSVAQSLIEAQGGRMWAESQVGRGSTFHFTLPLA
jgi:two-component system OmpR family sensor kinase/two-component system sensor histidine kinase BaeS